MPDTIVRWSITICTEAITERKKLQNASQIAIIDIMDELTANYMDHDCVRDLTGEKKLLKYINPDPALEIIYTVDHDNKKLEFLSFAEIKIK